MSKNTISQFSLPVYVSAKHIMIVLDVSMATANRRLALYKSAKMIMKYKKILLIDFFRYFEINLDLVYEKLKNAA